MPWIKDKYPADWKDRIRPDILKRDHYKCKRCGVPQRSKGYRDPHGEFILCDDFMLAWAQDCNLKIITIFLAVAHLNHDTSDNDYGNLASMCQQCHNRHDSQHRAMNRKIRAGNTRSRVNSTESTGSNPSKSIPQ